MNAAKSTKELELVEWLLQKGTNCPILQFLCNYAPNLVH